MIARGLDGIGILVTRPLPEAEWLAAFVRDAGGVPTVFPGVEIEPAAPEAVQSRLSGVGQIDLAVFVSPTAVRLGLPQLRGALGPLDRLRLAAVGPTTAAELQRYGLTDIIAPHVSSGGQALADEAALGELSGRNVLIVRGEGGSEAIGERLVRRGARVHYLECYRRRLPRADFAPVATMLCNKAIKAWMATSGQILDNLFVLAGKSADALRNTPLFVNHPQVAERGWVRGVRTIFVATGGNEGLVHGLGTWFCRLRPNGLTQADDHE